jgi:hypothetical protein
LFSSSSLTSVPIPENVEIVGRRCFSGCAAFTHLCADQSSQLRVILEFAFSLTQSDISVTPVNQVYLVNLRMCPELCKLKLNAFRPSLVTTIKLWKSVDIIGNNCFTDSDCLRQVDLPNDGKLKQIMNRSFQNSGIDPFQTS